MRRLKTTAQSETFRKRTESFTLVWIHDEWMNVLTAASCANGKIPKQSRRFSSISRTRINRFNLIFVIENERDKNYKNVFGMRVACMCACVCVDKRTLNEEKIVRFRTHLRTASLAQRNSKCRYFSYFFQIFFTCFRVFLFNWFVVVPVDNAIKHTNN